MIPSPEYSFVGVEQARRIIQAHVPAPTPELLEIEEAQGLVLLEGIKATEALPRFTNSAMDGFAVRAHEVRGASPSTPMDLPLAGEIAAGSTARVAWPSGTCIRILTGAPVPSGCDGVIPVEETVETTEENLTTIRFLADLDGHDSYLRPAGEDVHLGDTVLQAGKVIGPPEIALLASLGITHVLAGKRPSVGFLATGSELIPHDEIPKTGQIRNSNIPQIMAMLAEIGANSLNLGTAPDHPATLEASLADALARCDVLLTSGGVSAGKYDLVIETLTRLGATCVLHKVAQKPGKPLAFLLWRGKPIFGLPGNPISVFTTTWYYVGPALRQMMGHPDPFPPQVVATLEGEITGIKSRAFFARATTTWESDRFVTRPCPPHGSHIFHSMTRANSFILIPEGAGHHETGDSVRVGFFRSPFQQCPIP